MIIHKLQNAIKFCRTHSPICNMLIQWHSVLVGYQQWLVTNIGFVYKSTFGILHNDWDWCEFPNEIIYGLGYNIPNNISHFPNWKPRANLHYSNFIAFGVIDFPQQKPPIRRSSYLILFSSSWTWAWASRMVEWECL